MLVSITFGVYLQVANHTFLNLDDPDYVTDNLHVSSGISVKNITWAFSSVEAANWHPVTWLSHMADAQFYGLNPRGHHLTSVAIHSVSALLLFFLLLRLTDALWQSLFVASMFALHPLHVESVAWVAERKDVLSAFFCFTTLIIYSEYVVKQKPALYVAALFFFLCGLMSKPMLVTLPVVMMLIDFWPLDRYRDNWGEPGPNQYLVSLALLVKEKIPFFVCSILSVLITLYAQGNSGAIASLAKTSLLHRIENSVFAYVKYIGKLLWPRDLAIYYPFPLSIPLWNVIVSLLFLLMLSVAAIRLARSRPYFTVGWFWFLITLLPVIGLIQVGEQSMADRYSYIPATGVFILLAWGVPSLIHDVRYRQRIAALFFGTAVIASAIATWNQLRYWRDDISMYQHSLKVTSGSTLLYNNLGLAYATKNDLDAAIREYIKALRLNPDYADAHNNMGVALHARGELDAAILEHQRAIQLRPGNSKMHYNLGCAFDKRGNPDEARHEYQEALRISPGNIDAHCNLGVVLAKKGDLDAAIQEFRRALLINPDDTYAKNNLAIAIAQKRK